MGRELVDQVVKTTLFVKKYIESQKVSQSESLDDVLRRLLKLKKNG